MEPTEAPWQKVVTASDCDMCPLCDEPICPHCDSHYAQCDCLGLHEDPDQYEYCCIDWQWFIRPKHPEQPLSNHVIK